MVLENYFKTTSPSPPKKKKKKNTTTIWVILSVVLAGYDQYANSYFPRIKIVICKGWGTDLLFKTREIAQLQQTDHFIVLMSLDYFLKS